MNLIQHHPHWPTSLSYTDNAAHPNEEYFAKIMDPIRLSVFSDKHTSAREILVHAKESHNLNSQRSQHKEQADTCQ